MSAPRKARFIRSRWHFTTDRFAFISQRLTGDCGGVLLLFLIACQLSRLSVSAQVVHYDITAARASLADLNSAEQTLGRVYSSNSPFHFRITVALTNYPIGAYSPLKRSYSQELRPFLAATAKVVTNDLNLAALSQQLWPADENVTVYVTNAVRWVATNIVYDSDLADRIGSGESDTRSSTEVLALRKGTCSECANLFLALMRYKSIPAAYITGYAFKYGYHAGRRCIWMGPDGSVSILREGPWASRPGTSNSFEVLIFQRSTRNCGQSRSGLQKLVSKTREVRGSANSPDAPHGAAHRPNPLRSCRDSRVDRHTFTWRPQDFMALIPDGLDVAAQSGSDQLDVD